MLTLHHAPNSRAGRIVWLLEELGLEYTLNRMDFHPRDLKSDEHRARRIREVVDGTVVPRRVAVAQIQVMPERLHVESPRRPS